MKIQFKLRAGAEEGERRRVVHDVAHAERLFPADDDPNLGALYVADVPAERAEATLDELQRSSAVEFAEPQAERGLHAR